MAEPSRLQAVHRAQKLRWPESEITYSSIRKISFDKGEGVDMGPSIRWIVPIAPSQLPEIANFGAMSVRLITSGDSYVSSRDEMAFIIY